MFIHSNFPLYNIQENIVKVAHKRDKSNIERDHKKEK